MDADCPFFVPPPFAPFSSNVQEKDVFDEECQPISELELHFNTLFMIESEKGRGGTSQESNFVRHESFASEQSDYGSLASSHWSQNSAVTDLDNLWYPENDAFSNNRLTPDSASSDVNNLDRCPLPPMETAFSKHFKFASIDASIPQSGMKTCNNLDLYPSVSREKPLTIDNLDSYNHQNNLDMPVEQKRDKSMEYATLLDNLGFDDNDSVNIFDFDRDKMTSSDGDLIADLDSLNYFQDEDDDDMVGFEECWMNDSSSLETKDSQLTVIKSSENINILQNVEDG